MATKTGDELQASLLGDAAELDGATAYTMDVVDIRFGVKFDYTIPNPVAPDTGERQIGRVVKVTPAQLNSILDATARNALLNYLASQA